MNVLETELPYFDRTRNVLWRGANGHQFLLCVHTDRSVSSTFNPVRKNGTDGCILSFLLLWPLTLSAIIPRHLTLQLWGRVIRGCRGYNTYLFLTLRLMQGLRNLCNFEVIWIGLSWVGAWRSSGNSSSNTCFKSCHSGSILAWMHDEQWSQWCWLCLPQQLIGAWSRERDEDWQKRAGFL